MNPQHYKIPISVLVVIFSQELEFLLLERKGYQGFWQSVTGSIEKDESLLACSVREVKEELGINLSIKDIIDLHISKEFEIFSIWRDRYHPNVTHNREHWFAMKVDKKIKIKISDSEHSTYQWFNTQDAISKCFSWTNKQAIEMVAKNDGYLV